jgi:hypothetical protein
MVIVWLMIVNDGYIYILVGGCKPSENDGVKVSWDDFSQYDGKS